MDNGNQGSRGVGVGGGALRQPQIGAAAQQPAAVAQAPQQPNTPVQPAPATGMFTREDPTGGNPNAAVRNPDGSWTYRGNSDQFSRN